MPNQSILIRRRKTPNLESTADLSANRLTCILGGIMAVIVFLAIYPNANLNPADRALLLTSSVGITITPIISYLFFKKGNRAGWLISTSLLLIPLLSVILALSFISKYI